MIEIQFLLLKENTLTSRKLMTIEESYQPEDIVLDSTITFRANIERNVCQ